MLIIRIAPFKKKKSNSQQHSQSKGWEALSMVIGLCSNTTFKENQDHIKVMDRSVDVD